MAKSKLAAAVMLITFAVAAPAHAQPIEIGASVGRIGSWFASGGPYDGGDARVSLPAGGVGDVEILVGVAAPSETERLGLYAVQFKRPLPSVGTHDTSLFLTYGAGGVFVYDPRRSYVTPPVLGFIGGGIEQRIAARLAIRADVQGVTALVIPVGVRVAIGASVAVGRQSSAATAGMR